MSVFARNLIVGTIVAMVLLSGYVYYSQQPQQLTYSIFLDEVRSGNVQYVVIQESAGSKTISGQARDGERFSVLAPRDHGLIKELLDNNVEIEAKEPERRSIVINVLFSLLPA